MSTKYTPGPWNASERGTIISATVTREINGTMRTYQSKIAITPAGDRAERLANAHLIAAAPDLLAELQNIANAKPETWDEETRDQFQQWAQNRARAAIAKATGT